MAGVDQRRLMASGLLQPAFDIVSAVPPAGLLVDDLVPLHGAA
jgi:hypothetical protein